MILHDFLQSQNLLGGSVGFVQSPPKYFRMALSLLLLVGFITFITFVSVKEYFNQSIVEFSRFESQTKHQLTPEIASSLISFRLESVIDLGSRGCNLKMIARFNRNSYGNRYDFNQRKDGSGGFIYEAILENKENAETIPEYFNSKLSYVCLNKSSYEYLRYNIAFKLRIGESLNYSLNVFNKNNPFQIIESNAAPKISNQPSIYGNSSDFWKIRLKPITIVDDDSYFSIALRKLGDIEEELKQHKSKSYQTKITYLQLDHLVVPAILPVGDEEVIGFINFYIDTSIDIIVRHYPKFIYTLIPLLCIFFVCYFILRVMFDLYDSNMRYMEYINSFYDLTVVNYTHNENFESNHKISNEDTKPKVISDSFSNCNSKSFNNFDISHSGLSSKKNPLIEASFMRSEYAHTKATSKVSDIGLNSTQTSQRNKNHLSKENTFPHYSINNFQNKIEIIEEDLDQQTPCAISSSSNNRSFKFEYIDVFLFVCCPLFKRVKVKKLLYQQCKEQLKFFLNPHFYMGLCAINEERMSDLYKHPKNIYSAIIDFDREDYQIDRKSESSFSKLNKQNAKLLSNQSIEVSFEYRDG